MSPSLVAQSKFAFDVSGATPVNQMIDPVKGRDWFVSMGVSGLAIPKGAQRPGGPTVTFPNYPANKIVVSLSNTTFSPPQQQQMDSIFDANSSFIGVNFMLPTAIPLGKQVSVQVNCQ